MDLEDRELTAHEKLDLRRRMDIASACALGAVAAATELAIANGHLSDFNKSKLVAWSTAVGILGMLAGQYISSFFYIIAIFAAITAVNRYLEINAMEKKKAQEQKRIDDLRTIWLTGGHHESDLNALIGIALAAGEGGLDLDSEEYRRWWEKVREGSDLAVRFAQL